jgi:hypothetical protein
MKERDKLEDLGMESDRFKNTLNLEYNNWIGFIWL